MLYDLWCQVRDRQPDALALRELASGRTWSFLELDAATEQAHGHSALIEFPSGNDAEFVISVLRAWRHSTLLCPMDVGQTRPAIDTARLRESFPEIVHLKTTSASTGAAKTILFSSSQIAADANNIVATMGLIADSPNTDQELPKPRTPDDPRHVRWSLVSVPLTIWSPHGTGVTIFVWPSVTPRGARF